ncbi:MAG: aminopeptidase P family protein [Bacteroidaceae bacterium]|nr:aminopeptidase P family protein [Bacteroidaceae bacterium]
MTKAELITTRVEALRTWMREQGLCAYIFPSTDPHAGEYVPDHWKTREWISGFNGSAGTAVVSLTRAGLWTDSRYWLAADEQTAGTPFEVIRCGRNVATAEELTAWIAAAEQHGGDEEDSLAIGIDGWCVPQSMAENLQEAVAAKGMVLRTDIEPATALWADRPMLPDSAIELQPLALAGETAQSKIGRIREAVQAKGANAIVITQLDDIAWTLNLRGTDVHCTPVFVSYLMIRPDATTLYIDPAKLTPEVAAYLREIGVQPMPYDALARTLAQSRELRGLRFLVDPDVTNAAIYDGLSMVETLENRSVFPDDFYANAANILRANAAPMASPIVEGECPVAQMKTLKNEAEIAGMRRAMLKDGVAMVQFLRWLDHKAAEGLNGVSEITVDQQLTALRAAQEDFRDISFDTIAGYGAHAAIVHYEATPETDIPLQPHGLLLLDSGAQYTDGTTDITRTIALGPLTDDERRDYTLVLKGHIRLAMAVFPEGSSGTQLDVLARYAMWQEHKNYGHGTGHGVGSYLSVHEGPHQFRMNWMPAPLRAGMTITIEPGIYIAGSHGCRTENTMLIVAAGEGWLRMEPLTLCPIDTRPIVREMMADDEVAYLNAYHAHVCEALLPLLGDEADREWLRRATTPIA